MNLLEMNHVKKSFGDLGVIQDISLHSAPVVSFSTAVCTSAIRSPRTTISPGTNFCSSV